MSEKSTAARPPQVTVAGWVTILSSAFLVAGMFDAVIRLRSIESQERIKESLSEPPFDGLGMGVDGVQQVLHTVFVVAGGLGAAACVLGWFVLQRHKQSRLALSIVAVPLFVSGLFSGSVAASLVAVSAMLLWSGPARDWFAGRPVRQPTFLLQPPRSPGGAQPPVPPVPPAPPAPSSRVEAPHLPPVPPGVASDVPPPYAGYGLARGSAAYAPVEGRPPALLAAAVLTWIGTSVVLAVLAFAVHTVLTDDTVVREAIAKAKEWQPEAGATATVAQVRVAAVVGCAVFGLWALGAAVLAVLVMRRVAWARSVLVVSSIASGMLSSFGIAAIFPVVTAVAGLVTAYLLLRPEVARWVSRH
ncbi:hypothetical protein [Nocardioides jiangxiensis]|uniref:Uncharacterized protein n=1 Tax=Nocardioides jiangxiensis TaxID=3064524 RepID=A0ABT9AZQ4_9ACTN|nr:hypothetical protein [Nocardioides sp. WY-20]MDO7867940.1 hypothetical protein [Nocardioides sp. WY-20]